MKYHVSGIGNALLDLTINVDDDLLHELNLTKGTFKLLDFNQIHDILWKIKDKEIKTTPGGSVANVLAGISAFGGKTVLLGKVGNDKYGKTYEDETIKAGTDSKLSIHETENTGNAITFITPDGERTFAVNLGAAVYFNQNDINEQSIIDSQILHIEGFKLEDCKESNTIIHAADIAKNNNVKISVDLSDSELIKRNLNYLKDFINKYADIVFANDEEAAAFTGLRDIGSVNKLKEYCDIAIVKLGENGSLIKTDDQFLEIPVCKTTIKNTNGAGDMYAAGILYGLTNNIPLEKAGNIASKAASLVVAEEGSRINKDISNLLK